MKAKSLLFLLTLTILSSVRAQSGEITGMVSSGLSPLSYAIVQIDPGSRSTVTDSAGRFRWTGLNDGNYSLSIRRIGYQKQIVKISISESQRSKYLKIELLPNPFSIKTIQIDAKRGDALSLFGKLDLQLRPVASSQDLLRIVPGLFIAQHAGGGKAEQIFLRGFDVDHGTDFALFVDGMPVNMISHAHGQGYADLHFLIPETVFELEVNKGPHTTRYGDLATAGSGEFRTLNALDRNRIKLESGMFGTQRVLGMFNLLPANTHLFTPKQEHWYLAVEYKYSNSYFDAAQHFNRYNVFTKYNGELRNGDRISLSLSTFQSRWYASGQIPERKVVDGSLSDFGSIDPTEGGQTGRSNFNLVHERTLRKSNWKNQLYYSRYDLRLYSNFSFFMNDTVNGDQIGQFDNRNILGYNSVITLKNKLRGRNLTTALGAGLRYDNALIQLNHTLKRQFLNTLVAGKLNQINGSFYADLQYDLSNRLKANLGTRADFYQFDFRNRNRDSISGKVFKSIVSPKLNLTYTLNTQTRFFVKSGLGFHSNDARAVIVGDLQNTLARAFGNEIGSVFKPGDKWLVNVALWSLHLQNELVYVGDAGMVEVSGRTARVGIDAGMRYQLADYFYLDADLNCNRGRFTDAPAGADRIPLAPVFTSSGGITYKKPKGLNGNLRYRWMGDRPATEDKSLVAKGYFLLDLAVNYNRAHYQIGCSVENLLNATWKEAQFATESRLREERDPVTEIHFTPGTPIFGKINFSYMF